MGNRRARHQLGVTAAAVDDGPKSGRLEGMMISSNSPERGGKM
jgi:hypothetical protein